MAPVATRPTNRTQGPFTGLGSCQNGPREPAHSGSEGCLLTRRSAISCGMPSVAEQLRRAREAQGLSLRELAELTKIRADHIRALEEANYAPFPAPVYIRGSVRTCATLLKMDVAAVVNDLDRELAQS